MCNAGVNIWLTADLELTPNLKSEFAKMCNAFLNKPPWGFLSDVKGKAAGCNIK